MPNAAEVLAGLALVFVLPGFAIGRAVFPERRLLRPFSLYRITEEAAMALVLSVAVTILAGFAWLGTSTGVEPGWSDPILEATLALITLAALGVAAARGGFRRLPPAAPAPDPAGGLGDPMEIVRDLERLHRTERRLLHELRVGGGDPDAVRRELDEVRAEIARRTADREAEYALA